MQFRLFILVVSSVVAIAQAETPQAVGWRTDGTGLYPQAEPPATWAADKNVIWATPMPGWSNATPILVGDKIFVCSEPTALLCVSAADGKVLARRLGQLEYCTPVVHGGAVYFIEHGGKAVKLPTGPAEKIEIQRLWQTKPKKDRYYASPLYYEGLIYAVTRESVFSAIDAKTGKVVYEQKLELGKGTVFTSVTAAGKHLFVSSDNGTTIVIQPAGNTKRSRRTRSRPFALARCSRARACASVAGRTCIA